MPTTRILVVDDEPGIRAQMSALLTEEGYETEVSESGVKALEMMGKKEFGIVITDLMMPDLDGMTLLREIKDRFPDTVVIMITGRGSERKAVEAMKAGAYDYIPKPFYPEEILIVIEKAAERLRLKEESRLFQQHLEEELAEAQHIQEALLPQLTSSIDGVDIGAFSLPAKQVGGDYHDLIELPDGKIGIAIGDVSGKGMPAALLMASVQASLRAYAENAFSPGKLIEKVNQALCRYIEDHKFVTLFYGVLDTVNRSLTYSNAGHNYPLMISSREEVCRKLDTTGMPCGIIDFAEFDEGKIDICPGDLLFFYTDGVTEAVNLNEEMFGLDRLKEVLTSCWHLSASEIVERVRDRVFEFTGDVPQYDDFTIIALKT